MNVFNRYKNCRVEQIDSGSMKVVATMCDTFHEISVTIVVKLPELIIQDARAEFVRQPDELCRRTAMQITKLRGVKLGRGIYQQAKASVGGKSGCVHLMDLVLEAAKAVLQAKFVLQFQEYDDKDLVLDQISREFRGTCLFHSRELDSEKEPDRKEKIG